MYISVCKLTLIRTFAADFVLHFDVNYKILYNMRLRATYNAGPHFCFFQWNCLIFQVVYYYRSQQKADSKVGFSVKFWMSAWHNCEVFIQHSIQIHPIAKKSSSKFTKVIDLSLVSVIVKTIILDLQIMGLTHTIM